MTDRSGLDQKLHLQSTALDAAANAIVITNRDGIIQWVNPAFTKITGYSSDEIVGEHTRVLKSGKHDHLFYESLWNTVLSGNVWEGELINKRKDGSFYYEEQTITPVKDKNGSVTHFIAIKQDVTEKKKLEQQLLQSQRLESMGTLASGIAHDLNNIFHPIMLGLSMIKEESNNEYKNKWINMLEESANRGVSVLSQLLSFARGSGEEFELVNLRSLINETTKMLKATFPKDIEIVTDIGDDLWDISGNITQIHQVVMNICLNARDAMPNGGKLSIDLKNINIDESYAQVNIAAEPGTYVFIEITDNGIGIENEHLDKIFDPFYTTKEQDKGTGLGLSISYKIIRDHNGFIHAYSEPGSGTEFKIYIPAIIQGVSETKEQALSKQAPQGNGELILVVDDESIIREVTKQTLESNGYRVVTADNGIEAVAKYVKNKEEFEVVIMDSMMPKMSGPASIKALKRINPDLKIIYSSGIKREAQSVANISDDEINAELVKPYTIEQLLNTIHSVL